MVKLILLYSSFFALSLTATLASPVLSQVADEDAALYPTQPDERHNIKPTILYESSRSSKSTLAPQYKDTRIIYVKLLKNYYHPKWVKNVGDLDNRKPDSYEVFYVKALTNGQFSTGRIKLMRVPEFVAINVYKKIANSSQLE